MLAVLWAIALLVDLQTEKPGTTAFTPLASFVILRAAIGISGDLFRQPWASDRLGVQNGAIDPSSGPREGT